MCRDSAFHRAGGAIILLSLLSCLCYGQSGRGGISGLVTDSTGAVVPGAKLTVVNLSTGVTLEGTATSAGLYSFTALVPGNYRISATFQGFRTIVRDSVPAEVDRVSEVNLELNPGDVTETSPWKGSRS
jgi:hypothetical protein